MVINEPVLTQIFQNYKFLKLPKTKPEDISSSTLKPNTPAVEFSYFPTNWICSDSEKAHIEFYLGITLRKKASIGVKVVKSQHRHLDSSAYARQDTYQISIITGGHTTKVDGFVVRMMRNLF